MSTKPWNKAGKTSAERDAFKEEVKREVLGMVDDRILDAFVAALKRQRADIARAQRLSESIDTLQELNPEKYGSLKDDLLRIMIPGHKPEAKPGQAELRNVAEGAA